MLAYWLNAVFKQILDAQYLFFGKAEKYNETTAAQEAQSWQIVWHKSRSKSVQLEEGVWKLWSQGCFNRRKA